MNRTDDDFASRDFGSVLKRGDPEIAEFDRRIAGDVDVLRFDVPMNDAVLMRVLDVLQSFPGLVSAIAVATVLGTGLGNSILAIGISFMPPFARLMRANILQIRGSEYIEAATIMRCSTGRIIMRHLVPNAISPIIVQISMSIAQAALTASTLSFLGLGVKEPTPEWGSVFFRGKPASGAPGEGLCGVAVGAGTTVGELTVWENLLVLRPRSAPLRVLNARTRGGCAGGARCCFMNTVSPRTRTRPSVRCRRSGAFRWNCCAPGSPGRRSPSRSPRFRRERRRSWTHCAPCCTVSPGRG